MFTKMYLYINFIPKIGSHLVNLNLCCTSLQSLRFNSNAIVKPVNSANKSNSRRPVNIVYKEIDQSKYAVLYKPETSTDDKSIEESQFWNKIKQILKEYDYLKYMGGQVPSDISVEQMSDLLYMTNGNEKERKKYFRYLFLTESRKLKDKLKKAERSKNYHQFLESKFDKKLGIWDDDGQLSYRLWGNTLMARISSGCVTHLKVEPKIRFATQFGQKLVIDMDYDDFMNLNECRIQARHVAMTLSENLHTQEPFNIYLANCNWKKPTMKAIDKLVNQSVIQNLDMDHHFRTESYLDLFPSERLVYLSPNASESMDEYNHDDIYIVGGFLDKTSLNQPISHLKATREGIRQYRLPLDEHLVWGSGSSKHLCIMHIVSILNHLKTFDIRQIDQNQQSSYSSSSSSSSSSLSTKEAIWRAVLQANVPKRKVKQNDVILGEEEERRILYLRRKLQIESDNFRLKSTKE